MLKKLKCLKFNGVICILSFIYASLFIFGYSIDKDFSFSFIVQNPLMTFMCFIFVFCTSYVIIANVYTGAFKEYLISITSLEGKKIKNSKIVKGICLLHNAYEECDAKHNYNIGFIIKFVIILVVFGVFFLRFYPGVITPDTTEQIGSMFGIYGLSNHHPIFHTIIIGACLKIGNAIFGSYNAALALYSIIQMVLVSLTFSYVLTYLKKNNCNLWIRSIILLFFMAFPTNIVFSFTIWKDIPFSLSVLFFIIYLNKCIKSGNFKFNVSDFVFLCFFALLLMLFRNNGQYLILFLLIALIFSKVKQKRIIITGLTITYIIYILYLHVLLPNLGVGLAGKQEMLSIPFQQYAKIANEQEEKLSEDQIYKINEYLDYNTIKKEYNPIISDPVKATFKKEGYSNDPVGIVKLYFELFFKFPKESVEAFFSNTYGYWYPFSRNNQGVSRAVYENTLLDKYNIKRVTIINSEILNKYIGIANFNFPIIGNILSPGVIFDFYLLIIGYVIYSKRKDKLIIFVPLIALFLTCVAGPVNGCFRYFYALYLCLPFIACSFFIVDNK